MAYRKRNIADSQERPGQWRSWCSEHRAWIEASGVPETVFRDEHHWRDFLEISDLYPVGFEFVQTTLPQKVALLRLISTRPIDCSTPVAGCMIEAVLNALEPRL